MITNRQLITCEELLDEVTLVARCYSVGGLYIFRRWLSFNCLRRCVRCQNWILSKDFASSLLRLRRLSATALLRINAACALPTTVSGIATVQLVLLFIIIVFTVLAFYLVTRINEGLLKFVEPR